MITQLRYPTLSQLALILVIVFAALVRINGLGDWSFSIDEYYFAQSINNLLEHGTPKFELGGYYTRGVIQQYLSAPLLQVFGDPEFAVRLVPLIASILTIWAAFSIGRLVGGTPVAVITAIILGMSVWESEFARFARMYAPYQCVFVWYVYFLVKACQSTDRKNYVAMFALSGIGIFAHETGVILPLLNFLPFFFRRTFPQWYSSALTVIFLIVAAFYQLIDFRNLTYEGNSLPHDYIGSDGESLPILIPDILATGLGASAIWLLAFLVAIIFFAAANVTYAKQAGRDNLETIAVLMIGILCLANQFLLAFIVLFIALMLGLIRQNEHSSPLRRHYKLVFACSAMLVFWVGYGMLNDAWMPASAGMESATFKHRALLLAQHLFDYPQLVERFLKPSLASMPGLFSGLFLLLGVGAAMVILNRKRSDSEICILYAVVAIAISFICVLPTQYQSTRYSFFVYPLLVVLGCQVVNLLLRRFVVQQNFHNVALGIVVLGLFVLSEDFSARHLINIDSAEVNFRKDMPVRLAKLYYRRWDFSSPADFVNSHSQDTDIVLLVEVTPTAYYLARKPDYIFLDQESRRFGERSRESGTLDIWTNSTLISEYDELKKLLAEPKKDIWMVTYNKAFDGSDTGFRARFGAQLRYTSIDDAIDVYFINRQTVHSKNSYEMLIGR